jgi:dTDP-4-dehydrorhamnose reductase
MLRSSRKVNPEIRGLPGGDLSLFSALHYRARVDLLVIGGSGLLGLRITRQAQLAGHRVVATFYASVPPTVGADWRRLDIRRRDDVTALALDVRSEVIINAAYRQSDWETTADGAVHVALRAATGWLGALDVRLDSTRTQARLATRLRGAREFLAPTL